MMTKEEFVMRFKARMVDIIGEKFVDGEIVAIYANEVAMTYWNDVDYLEESPEECVEAEISRWGEP